MTDETLAKLIAAGDGMTLERLAAEKFEDVAHVHDWRNYIPDEVVDMWPALDGIARMSIYIIANRAANMENWDW